MTERAELVATLLDTARRLAVLGACPDELEAMEQIDAALVAEDLIRAFSVSCVARLDRSRTLEGHGYGTAKRFLIDVARMRPAEADRRQSIARTLPNLAATAEAFAAGEVCYDQAVGIVSGCRSVDPVDMGRAETTLLGLARRAGTSEVISASRRIRYLLDPDHYTREREYREGQEHLRITPAMVDQYDVRGLIPAAEAKQVLAAVDAYDRAHPNDPRTKDQRTLTVFRQSLNQQVTAEVCVTVDVKDLTDQDGTGVGQFLDGTFVPADRIKDMATRGWHTRIMTSGNQPLNVGRAKRFATPAIRKAVTCRDRHCVVRGCTTPGAVLPDRPPHRMATPRPHQHRQLRPTAHLAQLLENPPPRPDHPHQPPRRTSRVRHHPATGQPLETPQMPTY